MRSMIVVLASLAMFACGGVEDEAPPASQTQQQPGLEGRASPLEAPVPLLEPAVEFELVWTRAGLALQMVQWPVEERFYYPVGVTMPPPALPTAPCPACR